jgi:putative NADH-flavin reductase
MSKIVIFGIAGYAGTAIANELLDRGHQVVGVARRPDEVAARADLEVRAGSVFDPTLVDQVVEGAQAIVIAIRVLPDDGVELAPAIPALLKAAEASGARIGVVGGSASLFVADGGPRVIDAGFPEEYRAEAEAHGRVLEALQTADTIADWFYVSPPFGFGANNPGTKTGTFRLGTDVLVTDAAGNANISGADFAIAIADEIDKPTHHQARFTLGY